MNCDKSIIEFKCCLDTSIAHKILDCLPEWRTVVVSVEAVGEIVEQLRCFIAASTSEDINIWLEQLQNKSKTTYSIRTTYNTYNGTYVKFKRRLNCQHKKRLQRVRYPAQVKVQNTGCPSRIVITLHSERVFLSDKALPSAQFPCEIIYGMKHNHEILKPDALRFRSVSKEVKDKLIDLFKKGHTAATALEMIKTDIFLNNDDFKTVLNDRFYCPDYRYCAYIYNKEFKNKFGPIDFDKNNKEFLINKIQNFNKAQEASCADIIFSGEEYVVSICPPLLKRVHMNAPVEAVYIMSSSGLNQNGNGIFIISTCGCSFDGLPLGIIISSVEDTTLFSVGVQLLHNLLGNDIFGGNIQGPKFCLVDDWTVETSAVAHFWADTKCFLSVLHVLHSMWSWLTLRKNNIPPDKQYEFYETFKRILYAKNEDECNRYYQDALTCGVEYPNYCNCIRHYWLKRETWALCFRDSLLADENYINCIEVVTKLIISKIFQKTRSFNMEQLVDYVLTTFTRYYEVHFLQAASSPFANGGLGKLVDMRLNNSEKIIQQNEFIVFVGSEEDDKLFYIVNPEVLMCSCNKGIKDNVCKHIEWACSVIYAEGYNSKISTVEACTLLYKIITGHEPFNESTGTNTKASTISYSLNSDENDSVISSSTSIEANNELEVSSLKTDSVVSYNNDVSVSSDVALLQAQEILKEINVKINSFLNKSPQEVVSALAVMSEQMNHFSGPSKFASACLSFGKD